MSEGGGRFELESRVREVLDEWFWAIALVAIVVACAGGYATYTAYANPGTTVEERQVSNWEGNGSYTATATVSEANPLYAEGTELSNRPAYFLAVSPRLDGTFAFEYRASGDGAVDVTVDQTLVLRSVESDGGEESAAAEYWRIEEPLDSAAATDVTPGQPVRSSFSRNVSRVANRVENISDRLGGAPGQTQILIVSSVGIEGEVNGQSIDRQTTYRLPIGVDGATYRLGEVSGESVSGTVTETVTRERTYGSLYRIGGPVALLVGLLGTAGLGYGRYDDRFVVSEAERTRLEFESTREEFEDWITTATLPDAVLDRPRVDIDSLDGLVDTAIDVDARVFEHPEDDAFYVTHEGLLYVYEPPAAGLDVMFGSEEGSADDADDADDADESS